MHCICFILSLFLPINKPGRNVQLLRRCSAAAAAALCKNEISREVKSRRPGALSRMEFFCRHFSFTIYSTRAAFRCSLYVGVLFLVSFKGKDAEKFFCCHDGGIGIENGHQNSIYFLLFEQDVLCCWPVLKTFLVFSA